MRVGSCRLFPSVLLLLAACDERPVVCRPVSLCDGGAPADDLDDLDEDGPADDGADGDDGSDDGADGDRPGPGDDPGTDDAGPDGDGNDPDGGSGGPGDPADAGDATAPGAEDLLWHLPATGGASLPAIAADGALYVLLDRSFVARLDPAGHVVWSVDVEGRPLHGYPVLSSDDARVYVVSEEEEASPYRRSAIFAFDAATGVELWRAEPETFGVPGPSPGGRALRLTPPAVAPDGAVVVGDRSCDLGTGSLEPVVVALDPFTGAERWKHQAEHCARSAPVITANGDVVFDDGGDLEAVASSSGAPRWTQSSTLQSDAATRAAVAGDGALVVGGFSVAGGFLEDAMLYAATPPAAGGTLTSWRFELVLAADAAGEARPTAPTIAADGAIWVGFSAEWDGTLPTRLLSTTSTGTVLVDVSSMYGASTAWECVSDPTQPVAVEGGRVYTTCDRWVGPRAGAFDGSVALVELTAAGAVVRVVELPGVDPDADPSNPFARDVAVGPDGTIYVPSTSTTGLFAVRGDRALSGAWPKAARDAGNRSSAAPPGVVDDGGGDPPPPASCVGACGGQSADGACWCEPSCVTYGDCCADYDATC